MKFKVLRVVASLAMKSLVVFLSVLAVGLCDSPKKEGPIQCILEISASGAEVVLPTEDWIDIKDACVTLARHQIRMKFEAALAYLQLGAYFNQYDVSRPGFAKLFFDSASEGRSHAIKIFDHLLMRGQGTQFHTDPQLYTLLMGASSNKSIFLDELSAALKNKDKPLHGLEGLNRALDLEVNLTRSIKRMIRACENEEVLSERDEEDLGTGKCNLAKNDYHMVVWLITGLLDEQLKGQRELAGRISTLYKMREGYGIMADLLYDQELLEELDSKAA